MRYFLYVYLLHSFPQISHWYARLNSNSSSLLDWLSFSYPVLQRRERVLLFSAELAPTDFCPLCIEGVHSKTAISLMYTYYTCILIYCIYSAFVSISNLNFSCPFSFLLQINHDQRKTKKKEKRQVPWCRYSVKASM